MLTQGPAPDHKYKLNISLFLTLPHLLVCFICTRNSVHCIVNVHDGGLGQEGGGGGVVDSYQGLSVGTGGGYYHIVFFNCAFVFSSLMYSISLFKLLEHDSCCVCFCVYYFFSLSLVPLSWSLFCHFLGKGRVFLFESLFRVSALRYISSFDFQVKFIISAC